jgi:peptide/nickel transport system ATP-binding protein/oligopeptide transport system ATP-binding protein
VTEHTPHGNALPVETGAPPLAVHNLVKRFPISSGFFQRRIGSVHAVDGLSFEIPRGETLGLVGESGCGKSTLARTILKLIEPTSGEIRIGGTDVSNLTAGAMWPFRRRIQMVFQDPYSSLNPKQTAGEIVGEPLVNFGIVRSSDRMARVTDLLSRVGLRPDSVHRYPYEFSGGQRQRLGLAKALAVAPEVIVADEPVSALDASVQAQVLNLLIELQDELRIAYLFISHDLAVVRHISHRVAVMYLGKIVEIGPKQRVFSRPQHPYTQALISASPVPDPSQRNARRIILKGDVPNPAKPPPGCRFHTRCAIADARCRASEPPLREVAPGHLAACLKIGAVGGPRDKLG